MTSAAVDTFLFYKNDCVDAVPQSLTRFVGDDECFVKFKPRCFAIPNLDSITKSTPRKRASQSPQLRCFSLEGIFWRFSIFRSDVSTCH